ncbi:PepSY domain-containing protein [Rhodoferax sp.]|uniref:PepSY domain-containing protein n=1 Tax=Rhodoferax sp. TaxID=50421 RepID=UPI00260C4E08|nr:PepSY domain-containing protein [Rhodoferax sp.]MDD2926029.1 PepSY domain-containing protein [Rhodoferax sp.]
MKLRTLTLLASLSWMACQAQTPPKAAPKASAVAARPAAVSSLPGRDKPEAGCTTAPRSRWLPEEEMRLLAEHRGYRIKTFKVAVGNCYEIYGFDRNNQVVEAYFDPETSRLVRQNIAK